MDKTFSCIVSLWMIIISILCCAFLSGLDCTDGFTNNLISNLAIDLYSCTCNIGLDSVKWGDRCTGW